MAGFQGKEKGIRQGSVGRRVGTHIDSFIGIQYNKDPSTLSPGAFQQAINARIVDNIMVSRGGQEKVTTAPIAYAWDSLFDAGGGGTDAGLSLYLVGPAMQPYSTVDPAVGTFYYTYPQPDSVTDDFYVIGAHDLDGAVTFILYRGTKPYAGEKNIFHAFNTVSNTFRVYGMTSGTAVPVAMPTGDGIVATWGGISGFNTVPQSIDPTLFMSLNVRVAWAESGTVWIVASGVIDTSGNTQGYIWEVNATTGTVTTRLTRAGGFVESGGGFAGATQGFLVGTVRCVCVPTLADPINYEVINLASGATVATLPAFARPAQGNLNESIFHTSYLPVLGGNTYFPVQTPDVGGEFGVVKITSGFVVTYINIGTYGVDPAYICGIFNISGVLYYLAADDGGVGLKVYSSSNGTTWSTAAGTLAGGFYDMSANTDFFDAFVESNRLYVYAGVGGALVRSAVVASAANLTASFSSYFTPVTAAGNTAAMLLSQ